MRKSLTIIVLLCFTFFVKAQNNDFFSVNLGYQNLNGNYGTVGVSWLNPTETDNAFKISATALLAKIDDEFIIVPEIELAYLFFLTKDKSDGRITIPLAFYKIATSVTPYAVQPKIGFSLLTFWDVEIGYSLEFNEHDHTSFEGFLIGTKFNIPTFLRLN